MAILTYMRSRENQFFSKFFGMIQVLLIFCQLFLGSVIRADEIEYNRRLIAASWLGYTKGFRNEHHFSTTLGVGKSTWNLHQRYDESRTEKLDLPGIYTKLQYDYHIQVWRFFGIYLGSSLKAWTPSRGIDDFYVPTTWSFPGVLAGLVFNLSPSRRILIGVESNLDRVNGLRWKKDSSSNTIYVSMLSLAHLMIKYDYFYKLNWAVRLEAHMSRTDYIQPKGLSKNEVLNLDLNREDFWFGMGIVYHIL